MSPGNRQAVTKCDEDMLTEDPSDHSFGVERWRGGDLIGTVDSCSPTIGGADALRCTHGRHGTCHDGGQHGTCGRGVRCGCKTAHISTAGIPAQTGALLVLALSTDAAGESVDDDTAQAAFRARGDQCACEAAIALEPPHRMRLVAMQ